MASDFGFQIGNWNQAYQFDTLPKVISEEELQTGDLIFYEGSFFSSRSKKQKHNIVHVEIFLGGPESKESCIGARYQTGTIQIFPSFKFTSAKWSLISYHFRSIDTWLEGECVSHCAEHDWYIPPSSGYNPKSIFAMANDEAADEEQDEDVSTEKNEMNETINTADFNVNTIEQPRILNVENEFAVANRSDLVLPNSPRHPNRKNPAGPSCDKSNLTAPDSVSALATALQISRISKKSRALSVPASRKGKTSAGDSAAGGPLTYYVG